MDSSVTSVIVALGVTVVIVVLGVTVIYRVLPFRALKARKPRLAFSPKYVVRVTKSLAELELTLEKLEFKKLVLHSADAN